MNTRPGQFFKTVTKETGSNRNVVPKILWRMLQTSFTAKKSNETVLREADTTRSLMNKIHKH